MVVTVEQAAGGASIAVADADLARLGGRCVRLGRSHGREGSGLGFAIVQSGAQRLGAGLNVENTRRGLRVTVVFQAP